MPDCNVCNHPLTDPIYESASARSLTSLCTVYPGATRVYFCRGCGHLQSAAIDNIERYYDNDYHILVGSDEEDQIYEVVEGRNIYRTDHQLATLLGKLSLPAGAKILDYGCAKSSTMRRLAKQHPEISPYLFDVSDRYIPFWAKFVPKERWATYSIPVAWHGQFDAVTSFFSLEHMAKPQDALRQIGLLLKPAGWFYGIVPNVFSNTADLIVIDHVNHFTAASLRHLLSSQGFDSIEIDERSHQGALIFVARKPAQPGRSAALPAALEIPATRETAFRIAQFWKSAGDQVREFEQGISEASHVAIYGAGFYGAFIASHLTHPERIECVIDQNPFLHGKTVNGAPVVSPKDLPAGIDFVLVGLNPNHARTLISQIAEFKSRNLSYFFL